MHGALGGQIKARVERCLHVDLLFLAEHHGGGAARLPVHGYAHLFAIASVRGGPIDVIDGHKHQPGSVFAHAAGPLAHALLAVSERLLGIVPRKRIRQLVDDGALLQQALDGYHAEIAFLHSGVERGNRREIPWFEQAHERDVDEIGFRPRPVEHLEIHLRFLARHLPGKRRHHAQVGKLHGHVREGHLLLNGSVHIMRGEGVGVLMYERKGVRACLLDGDAAGKGLLRNIFRSCAHGKAFAERAGFQQIGNADLVAARGALEHALGGFALESRPAKRAGDPHMFGVLELVGGCGVFP